MNELDLDDLTSVKH